MLGLGDDVTDYPVHFLWLEIMLDVKFALMSLAPYTHLAQA